MKKQEILNSLKKWTLTAVAFWVTIFWMVYAANIISVTTQTISSGDSIGAGWYQAVNDKLLNTYSKTDVYTKTEVNGKWYLTSHQDITWKADKSNTYTKAEVDALINEVKVKLWSISSKPWLSCKDILDNWDSTWDWLYWISPDWWSAFQVHCDMTTDWWGWAMVVRCINTSMWHPWSALWNDNWLPTWSSSWCKRLWNATWWKVDKIFSISNKEYYWEQWGYYNIHQWDWKYIGQYNDTCKNINFRTKSIGGSYNSWASNNCTNWIHTNSHGWQHIRWSQSWKWYYKSDNSLWCTGRGGLISRSNTSWMCWSTVWNAKTVVMIR